MKTTPVATPAPAGAATLSDALRRWAARGSERPALTFLDHTRTPGGVAIRLTWRELDELVESTAAWLRPRVAEGDRVGVLVDQSPYYVAAFLGAIRARAVAVPLFPPGLPQFDERLAAVPADCSPSAGCPAGPTAPPMA